MFHHPSHLKYDFNTTSRGKRTPVEIVTVVFIQRKKYSDKSNTSYIMSSPKIVSRYPTSRVPNDVDEEESGHLLSVQHSLLFPLAESSPKSIKGVRRQLFGLPVIATMIGFYIIWIVQWGSLETKVAPIEHKTQGNVTTSNASSSSSAKADENDSLVSSSLVKVDTFLSYDEYDDDINFEDIDEWGNNTKTGKPAFVETVEVMHNNLQYRKACTNVGISSILCMTVRYPFEVPEQTKDPKIRYPSPVEPKFYDLKKESVYVIKLKDWIQCKKQYTSSNAEFDEFAQLDVVDDKIIEECLTNRTKEQMKMWPDKGDLVTVLWTRHLVKSNKTIFHGVGHDAAVQRVFNFFGTDHEILLTGASPSPMVTENLRALFGHLCTDTGIYRRPNFNCAFPKQNMQNQSSSETTSSSPVSASTSVIEDNADEKNIDHHLYYLRHRNLVSGNLTSFAELKEGEVNVANFDYRLLIGPNSQHHLDPMSTLDYVLKTVKRPTGYKNLRNMSLLVEYPFAHVQSQDMFQNGLTNSAIRGFQFTIPSHYTEFMSVRGKKKLAKRNGFDFRHLIVFDGIPQFYPTVTNGWTTNMYEVKTEMGSKPETFGYKGWKPEYGRSCVGPLPRNSRLREINLMSRTNFFRLAGHNYMTRWYGRTWEFVNLFWFQMKMCKYFHMKRSRNSFVHIKYKTFLHVFLRFLHPYFQILDHMD
jgi:hypothetical protein